jgi:hypothetical protein
VKPLSTINLPESPLPSTVPLSPVTFPDNLPSYYAPPVFLMPGTSRYTL